MPQVFQATPTYATPGLAWREQLRDRRNAERYANVQAIVVGFSE